MGDHSRYTFRPENDFTGVFEQQGRVRLDANLNELVDLLDRRLRTTAFDTFSGAVTPKTTPNGFEIKASGSELTIGAGRSYVDGIQVDNHGYVDQTNPAIFDGAIEEKRGIAPRPYSAQPYLPSPPPLPTTGTHVVYLDVWHRHRSWAEDPSLLDPALYGLDTATRRQVVWQVKVHSPDTPGVTCATPDASIPGWETLTSPCAAQLSTAAVGVPAVLDPCDIPALGGFRGRSNRLYRVELHDGGPMGTATFKWSRDNATLASPVTQIVGDELSIVRAGRDQSLRFSPGDRVEITDDVHELSGRSGQMAIVTSVDENLGVLRLASPLAVGQFDTTQACRVRRWDQNGPSVNAQGVIPVSPNPVVLEDGIEITFTLDPKIAGGQFHATQWWAFSVRVPDSSVEILTEAPPRGPHHHIARLAVVNFSPLAVDSDCRILWPQPCDGIECDCDVCVTEQSHNTGLLTIQQAVDKVRAQGGVVCLQPGFYVLHTPVRVDNANAVRIRGKGGKTVVLTPPVGPAFLITDSHQVTVEDLSVLGISRPIQPSGAENAAEAFSSSQRLIGTQLLSLFGGQLAIAVSNTVGINIERCALLINPMTAKAPTLSLSGGIFGLRVRECQILGANGIGSAARSFTSHAEPAEAAPPRTSAGTSTASNKTRNPSFILGDSRIEHNVIVGWRSGIAFFGTVIYVGANTLTENTIVGVVNGIALLGVSLLGSVTVTTNIVAAGFHGIACGISDTRILDNQIFGAQPILETLDIPNPGTPGRTVGVTDPDPCAPDELSYSQVPFGIIENSQTLRSTVGLPSAILVFDGLGMSQAIDNVRIEGNEIAHFPGQGIVVLNRIQTAIVSHNRISDVDGDAITVVGVLGGTATINHNVIRNVGKKQHHTAAADRNALAAIAVGALLDVDISHNQISGVFSTLSALVAGILVEGARDSRISNNSINKIGTGKQRSFGIHVQGPFDRTDIHNNTLRQHPDANRWIGIHIQKSKSSPNSPSAGYIVENETKFMYAMKSKAASKIDSVLYKDLVVHLLRGRETAAVRGNGIDGAAQGPMVLIDINGNAMVTENRVTFQSPAPMTPAVLVHSGSAIISSNYIEIPHSQPALSLQCPTANAVVTSNLTSGRLSMNGVPLPAPWNHLNQVGP
jgi:Family of unknown function (DUF6519)